MKRVLIIGAGGQDGTLLGELLKSQSVDYLGIDHHGVISSDGKRGQEGAVADARFIQDVVAQFLPSQVYYLAAHHHSSQDARDSSDASLWNSSVEVQILGLAQMLNALKLHAPGARLFYASSSHVFGSPEKSQQNEETPQIPVNVYGITKKAGSDICRHYREQHGLFASVGILYNHESVHRRDNFLSKKVIQAAIAIKRGSKERLVLGDLSAGADWGYAPDYVEAMTRMLELERPGEYVIATGESHTVREFVQIAFEQQGLDAREWVEENNALIQRRHGHLIGDAGKLRRDTGWKPSVSFREMIRLIGVETQKGWERMNKILVFIPTYEEVENVGEMCERIMALPLPLDLHFIDDGSPDGTGEALDRLAEKFSRVTVGHRSGKLGIGTAHREGIAYAYRNGYKFLVTMDCDFTHDPAKIPDLLNALATHHVVLGSRYLQKHSLPGWSLFRKLLTNLGHFLTRNLLLMKYDATGAFRLYDLRKIPHGFFQAVRSPSYAFFFESLFVLASNGFEIAEIPIALPARTYGHSKLSFYEAARSAQFLLSLSVERTVNPGRFRAGQAG